ncbi:beta-CASP ribonuclease aCPSF1 [Candidatus Woesearchaeota archaeon CG07_land_8_20_14_0_80_44_23]|nr:MAG: beta-CASP ribonuclease aCPSF1 [Candidatus Woesearchaeota archaeon CG07_land_8_20_14_0_80_44_23]
MIGSKTKILNEVLKMLPAEKISDAGFEGANIVLYTKDKDFFLDNQGSIKKAVNDIKKRVELRADPAITLNQDDTEDIVKQLIPEEAGMGNLLFDPQRSQLTIEAEKPGVAIGKQGSTLKEIREKTLWVPIIRRKPAIRSKIIESIRGVLYQNSDFRRKFLNETGHRIYDGWIRERRQEWVRISILGAGRQVGRSCLFLQTPESRVLLDCGVDVAADEAHAYPHIEAPELEIGQIDAIILTHAHLDHSGFIPYLFKYGYRGPVYCTAPTRDVAALTLLDYVKIMRSNGREPIYSSEDVQEMVKHTITLEYDEVTDITPDIRITLYNAGHILGSSMVHLHIGNGLHNMLYTADMKYMKTELLEAATTEFPRLESMIIESTYGGKDYIMPSRKECDDFFRQLITETIARGGKVLIPVLGTGRAQEIMLTVEQMSRNNEIPQIPVFIEGIVWDITAIHTAYPEFLNSTVRKQIFRENQNPFLSEIFKRVGSAKERSQLLEETGPCIILATSGMLVGGPSVEYLKELADNPKNLLIFVSYQGEGSLGRRIQRGEREFTMSNDKGNQELVKISMQVETIEGFSGHSSRKELLNFIYKCSPRPKKIIVHHGENSRCLDLASSIHKMYHIETAAPRNLEAIRLK